MKLKKTSLHKAFENISKNRKKAFYILVVDIVFIMTMLLLRSFMLSIAPSQSQLYSMSILLLMLFSISYIAFLILFYSVLKYLILTIIKSTREKAAFTLKPYLKFSALNIITLISLFIIFLIPSALITYTLKPETIQAVSAPYMILIMLFSYLVINISQTIYMQSSKILEPIKKTYSIIFKNGKAYYPILLNIAAASAAYVILGLLITLIFRQVQPTQTTIAAYKITYYALLAIILYPLVFFNRFQIYEKMKDV